LRTEQPGERPAGVPELRYRYPPSWVIGMGRDALLSRSRSVRDDAELAVRMLPRPPLADGLDHIPAEGSFVLIANHYQRRGLWIGWAAALLCHSLLTVRSDLSCHFVITDRIVRDGTTVPGTPWLFGRVANIWDFVPVTPPEALDARPDEWRRALRRCLRKLRREDGGAACLAIFPEGVRGRTRGLRELARGNGRSLLALAATGVPLLPAAVWEERDGALHARFGPLWWPAVPAGLPRALDRWAADSAMTRIAALLPEALRGYYSGLSMPEADTPHAG